MFKRILLTIVCASAFGAAGLAITDNANAYWSRRGVFYRPAQQAYYYGPGYGYGTHYRGYYRPRYYYEPRYYGGPRFFDRRYYGRPGASVSFAW